MFTDVAGFTELAQADEKGALDLIAELDALVGPLLSMHHGRKVKAMGDGLLIEFPDALNAVQCAFDFQTAVHERNSRRERPPVQLRVGLHLGDVERRGDDIVGDAVNLASRVEPIAEPGGICLSEQVVAQVRNKLPYRFETLGTRALKGVHEPVGLYRIVLPWTRDSSGPPAGGATRLAVLPLVNISPDPKDEYFADGLTEELITALSRIRGLRVIARTSVSQYKSSPKPIRQIGAELGVGTILEGSVRRAGERLRITLQLIDAISDEHRWAETFDRTLSDVFEIQAEVANRTAAALKVELLDTDRDALSRPPVRGLAAYELYLRGIVGFQRAADEGWPRYAIEDPIRCFEGAIAKDPSSAAARAWLANLYIAAMGETISKGEVATKVRELVTAAYRLDTDEAEVRTARGNYALQFERDWVRAEQEFVAAIEISPSAMSAHAWLGILQITLGRPVEAARELEIAIDLDPMFLNLTTWRIRALDLGGDLSAAILLAERTLERFPSNRTLHVLTGALYLRAGRKADAEREVRLAEGPQAGAYLATALAELRAGLGDTAEALEIVRNWETKTGERFIRPNYVAAMYAVLGEKEKALQLLEWDSRQGEQSLWIDFRRRSFDSIRDDPRFVALLKGMNLSP